MRKPYPTALTDEQWQVVQPLLPAAQPGGRPRTVDLREVVNTLFYQNRTGCQGVLLPHDLRPKSTVYDYCSQWRDDGTWQHLLDALREAVRQQAGRHPAPRAGSIASQTVQGTEVGGERGYDGNKTVNGRKRHIIVDTLGWLLAVVVTAAAADEGTTAPHVLAKLDVHMPPRLELLWADHKDKNRTLDRWLAQQPVRYKIAVVERPRGAQGCILLHRRWVVERTCAWLGRYRRNSKDYERLTASREAGVKVSMIHLMLQRLRPDKAKQAPAFTYIRKPRKAA
jgi:putative transposase